MFKKANIFISIGIIILLSSCVTGKETTKEVGNGIEHSQYEWVFETDGAVLSGAVTEEERVYFTSDSGILYCLDRYSGDLLFKYESGTDRASTPVIYKSNIIYLNGDGDLLVINKDNGELIKSINLGKTSRKDEWDYFLSEPLIAEDYIYAGAGNKGVYKIDADSLDIAWEYKTSRAVHNKAIIIKDKVIFGDMGGKNYCLNKDSGDLIWEMKTDDSVMGSYAYSNDLLFLGSRDTNTYAISINNGNKVWNYDHGHSWIMSTPVVDGDLLYVGGSDNFVVQAFNKETGEEVWSTNSSVNIATRPVVKGDLIYFTAGDSYNTYGKGALFVLDKYTGEMVYRFNTTSTFSSPSIVDNLAYFGTKKGEFYCVEIKL